MLQTYGINLLNSTAFVFLNKSHTLLHKYYHIFQNKINILFSFFPLESMWFLHSCKSCSLYQSEYEQKYFVRILNLWWNWCIALHISLLLIINWTFCSATGKRNCLRLCQRWLLLLAGYEVKSGRCLDMKISSIFMGGCFRVGHDCIEQFGVASRMAWNELSIAASVAKRDKTRSDEAACLIPRRSCEINCNKTTS